MQREYEKRLDKLEAAFQADQPVVRRPTWQPTPAQQRACIEAWVQEGIIAPTAPDGTPWATLADALAAALLADPPPPWLESFALRQAAHYPPGHDQPPYPRGPHFNWGMYKLGVVDKLPASARGWQEGETYAEQERRWYDGCYDVFFAAVTLSETVLQRFWAGQLATVPGLPAAAVPAIAAAMAAAGVAPTWEDALRWIQEQEGA